MGRTDAQPERDVEPDLINLSTDSVPKSKPRKTSLIKFKYISVEEKSPRSTPSTDTKPESPYTKPISSDWRSLEYFDRRVHLVQNGDSLRGPSNPYPFSGPRFLMPG